MSEQGSPSGSGQESTPGGGNPQNSQQSAQTASGGSAPVANQGNNGNSGSTDIAALMSRIEALEESNKEIPKLRAEAAKYRTKLKAIASDDEPPKDGNSGVNPETLAALNSLRDARIKDQLALAAREAGALAHTEIYRYFDLSEIASEDGTVDKPAKLMADLRKQYPFLFKPLVEGPADGANGSSNSGNPADFSSELRRGFRTLQGRRS